MQAGKVCEGAFNFGEPLRVAEVVLRVGFVPAIGLGQDRSRGDAHDGLQFFAGKLHQRGLILLGEVLGERAADEDAEQDGVAGSAVGKFL